tara:strand:+ start:3551 stop:3805 length:255 start_codon:yes stop_codon:yes gene_type:complete
MKEKIIVKTILQVLENNNWGIYFKGQGLQELPVNGEASMYRVNNVREESLRSAIEEELVKLFDEETSEGDTEWQHKEKKGSSET